MSNLSDLLPAGAGGKQVSFTASGSLSSGQTVALQSNGQVVAVSGQSESIGSGNTFTTNQTSYVSGCYNANNDVVIVAYQDNGNSSYGTVVQGTISGNTISFGTPHVWRSDTANWVSMATEPSSNHAVIAFQDGGPPYYANLARAVCVKLGSGNSISGHTGPEVIEDYLSSYFDVAYDTTNSKYIVAYRGSGSSSAYGTAAVGTRSGDYISFGTPAVFQSSQCRFFSVSHDGASGKNLICFEDETNSNDGKAVVGTVSGTSISYGSTTTFESTGAFGKVVRYSPDEQKHLLVYRKYDGSNAIIGQIATVSGTSVSFSATTTLVSGSSNNYVTADYAPNIDKFVVIYADSTASNYAKVFTADITGGSISTGSTSTLLSAYGAYLKASYNSGDENIIVSYSNGGQSDRGESLVYTPQSSNNTDFIGITDAAISSGSEGNVTIKGGISASVTGLTPNTTYYVQLDGSLSTTSSDVTAGKALSATSINLDYSS